MKRLMSIFLVLAMLMTFAPMNIMAADADKTAFSDVKSTDYYAQAATALAKLNILTGYPDGTFGAEKSITRAEMAAIVCRMIDKEADAEKAKGTTKFDDVAADHWASGYVNIASEKNIINGDGNGKFRPEDPVKHEEAIKMVVCTLGYGNNVETNPEDWSAGYIKVADEKGITDNLKGGKGNASTRGDVAVMTYNGLATETETSKIPATPVASKAAGEYKGTQKVTLTTKTKGADIYYTTDGTEPTEKSEKYTKEISITKSATLKAIAVDNGIVSKVMSVEYTI
ncbi:MAG: S-layer homology domain-containing protein, partial [Clostridia bacterium]|nr:S-layer homology domain-containing protein [Clostridia bacterium]